MPLLLVALTLALPPLAPTQPSSAIDTIQVAGALELTVTRDKDKRAVYADPRLIIEYSGSIITVRRDANDTSDKTPEIVITTPVLAKLNANGAVKVSLEDVHSDRLVVELIGATVVKAKGDVISLGLSATGANNFKGRDLTVASEALVHVSGASKAELYCDGKLRIDADGAAKVDYWGEPKVIERNVTGAASVKGH